VANALAKCVPIITADFLSDFLTCQKTKQTLPDEKNFVPALRETTININDVTLVATKERRQVQLLISLLGAIFEPQRPILNFTPRGKL
jgi:hypothetical protein